MNYLGKPQSKPSGSTQGEAARSQFTGSSSRHVEGEDEGVRPVRLPGPGRLPGGEDKEL